MKITMFVHSVIRVDGEKEKEEYQVHADLHSVNSHVFSSLMFHTDSPQLYPIGEVIVVDVFGKGEGTGHFH